MPSMQNAQSVALQLEKVRDKVPILYERDDMLLSMIQKGGNSERTSSRNYRIPVQIRPGGKAGMANMDGGDLGLGSGDTYEVPQVTPVFLRFATQINKLVEYATNSSEKAVENAAKRQVTSSMKQFRAFLDQVLQTAGQGVIGTIASLSSSTAGQPSVLTMQNPFGAQLVYYNQTILIANSALTTLRGSCNVTLRDILNKQITIDSLPANTVSTDVILVDAVTLPNPTCLFGIPYHQSNATTGTYENLNRATYPVELATPSVNCNSSLIVPANIRLAKNKIRMLLGDQHPSAKNKRIAHLHPSQSAAYEQLGITASQVIKESSGGSANDYDALFTGTLQMCGIPLKENIHADETRVDFLDLTHWGRAIMQDIDYYEVNGQTVFTTYGPSGGISASYLFYFVVGMQVFNDCPTAGAYMYNMGIPTGY